MEPKHLSRLQEEQINAIEDTKRKIEQLEKFKEDYTSLQNRLTTLPDKLSHDIMVPLGKLAFMPGKMVHTNEILVLLGDNWFVERSASQAVGIAHRRIEDLDKKLADLNSQRKLLEPRLNFTSEFKEALQKNSEVNEIVEEYDEEKERLWDEQHRKNVRKHKEEMKKHPESSREIEEERKENRFTDSDLWSRLDELEMIEKEKGELDNSSGDDERGDTSRRKEDHGDFGPPGKPLRRRVSWADAKGPERKSQGGELVEDEKRNDAAAEGDTEDSDDDEEEEKEMSQTLRRVITFSHTQTPAESPRQVFDGGDQGIQSPADIYKLFIPKSILKKTPGAGDFCNITEKKPSSTFEPGNDESRLAQSIDTREIIQDTAPSDDSSHLSSSHKAFTGLVLEKSAPQSSTSSLTDKPTAPVENRSSEEPKRMSKFKAGRLSQQQH